MMTPRDGGGGLAIHPELALAEWGRRLHGRVLDCGVERGWSGYYGRSVEELAQLLSDCQAAVAGAAVTATTTTATAAAVPSSPLERSGEFEAPETFSDHSDDSEDGDTDEEEEQKEEARGEQSEAEVRADDARLPLEASLSVRSSWSQGGGCPSPPMAPSSACAVPVSDCASPPLFFPPRGVTGRSEQRLRRRALPPSLPPSPSSPPVTLHPHPPSTPVSDTLRGRRLHWRSDSDDEEVEEGAVERQSGGLSSARDSHAPSRPSTPHSPTPTLPLLDPPHRRTLSTVELNVSAATAAVSLCSDAAGKDEDEEPGMIGMMRLSDGPCDGGRELSGRGTDEEATEAPTPTGRKPLSRRPTLPTSPPPRQADEDLGDGDSEPGLLQPSASEQEQHSRTVEEQVEQEDERSPSIRTSRRPAGRQRCVLLDEEEDEHGDSGQSAAPDCCLPLQDLTNRCTTRGCGRLQPRVAADGGEPGCSSSASQLSQPLPLSSSPCPSPSLSARRPMPPHGRGAVSSPTVTRSGRKVGWMSGWHQQQQPRPQQGWPTTPHSASLRQLMQQRKEELLHTLSGTQPHTQQQQQPAQAQSPPLWGRPDVSERAEETELEEEEEGEEGEFDWIVDDDDAGADGGEMEEADSGEGHLEELEEEEQEADAGRPVGVRAVIRAFPPAAPFSPRARVRGVALPSNAGVRLRRGNRDAVARATFEWLNAAAFSSQLPSSLPLLWSAKLNSTAGFCSMLRPTPSTRACSITLAIKVLDCTRKLQLTLAHEMCHAAAWLLDSCSRPPHGAVFRRWAARVEAKVCGLNISTCHRYDIFYKHRWQCSSAWCGAVVGRHSQSLDVERVLCAKCGGHFVPLGRFTKDGRPASDSKGRGGEGEQPQLNGFASFVQRFYRPVKKEKGSGTPHKEVMAELSRRYREGKATREPAPQEAGEAEEGGERRVEDELVQRVLQLELEDDDAAVQ